MRVETLGMTVGVFLCNQASSCGEVVGYDAEGPSIILCDSGHIEGTGKAPLF
jgi:hypothetical protein